MPGTRKAMKSDLDDRLEAVERLTRVFRLERIVYVIVTAISSAILFSSGVVLIARTKAEPAVLTLLFGSSGIIGYTSSRILQMWNESLHLLMGAGSAQEKTDE